MKICSANDVFMNVSMRICIVFLHTSSIFRNCDFSSYPHSYLDWLSSHLQFCLEICFHIHFGQIFHNVLLFKELLNSPHEPHPRSFLVGFSVGFPIKIAIAFSSDARHLFVPPFSVGRIKFHLILPYLVVTMQIGVCFAFIEYEEANAAQTAIEVWSTFFKTSHYTICSIDLFLCEHIL